MIKNKLEIIPVRWIDRVLEIALTQMPQPLPDVESVITTATPAPTGKESELVVKH